MSFKEKKAIISALWTSVMFLMVFADILSFIYPEFLKGLVTESEATGMQITQEVLLVFAILLAIPIAMIFLSRILKENANRWANTVSAAITTIFVIAGGSLYLHYIFFAGLEVVCMALIVWYSWRRTASEGQTQ